MPFIFWPAMPKTWLFYHGWGFSPSCWSSWASFLPQQQGIKTFYYDKGYFGTPFTSQSSGDQERIFVAHSLGAHFLPFENMTKSDVVILIGSFIHFHPNEKQQKEISQLKLERMHERLQSKPDSVLKSFYRECFFPLKNFNEIIPDLKKIERTLLMEDLVLLNTHSIPAKKLRQVKKVVIFHGQQDRIVSLEKSHELHQIIPKSSLYILPDQGHSDFLLKSPQYIIERVLYE